MNSPLLKNNIILSNLKRSVNVTELSRAEKIPVILSLTQHILHFSASLK